MSFHALHDKICRPGSKNSPPCHRDNDQSKSSIKMSKTIRSNQIHEGLPCPVRTHLCMHFYALQGVLSKCTACRRSISQHCSQQMPASTPLELNLRDQPSEFPTCDTSEGQIIQSSMPVTPLHNASPFTAAAAIAPTGRHHALRYYPDGRPWHSDNGQTPATLFPELMCYYVVCCRRRCQLIRSIYHIPRKLWRSWKESADESAQAVPSTEASTHITSLTSRS